MWLVIIIILDGFLHGNIWSKGFGGKSIFTSEVYTVFKVEDFLYIIQIMLQYTPSFNKAVFKLDQNRGALHPAPKMLCPSALFSHPLHPSALSTLPLHPSALFMPYMNPKRLCVVHSWHCLETCPINF